MRPICARLALTCFPSRPVGSLTQHGAGLSSRQAGAGLPAASACGQLPLTLAWLGLWLLFVKNCQELQ